MNDSIPNIVPLVGALLLLFGGLVAWYWPRKRR